MIRLWAAIANKLGISQEEALLLHAFLCGWLNDLARRRAQIVINDIVERFQLKTGDFTVSYARMLQARGVLTPTEAEVFAGNYHGDQEGTGTPPTPQDSPPRAPARAADLNLVPLDRIGRVAKRSRGPSDGNPGAA